MRRAVRDRGSFRDPGGFVFRQDGVAYRQVNLQSADSYQRLMASGLYDELVGAQLLVPHDEVALRLADGPPAHAVLRPEQIPFISYPYEWCFGQLKAAALLTLDIQRRALGRGQVLRDASAYNVQFVGTRPVFIDTLSFGAWREGHPWSAYRQFCQQLLAPLAMMALVDPALGALISSHVDGIPLPLAARALPFRARFRPGLLMHVYLHARAEDRSRRGVQGSQVHGFTGSPPQASGFGVRRSGMSRTAMLGLVDSLERTVERLTWDPPDTLWSSYGTHLNYSPAAQEDKRRIVSGMLERAARSSPIEMVWDLGANSGDYSRLAAERGPRVVSFDGDHAVVEQHYRQASEVRETRVLPLRQDLANPSPGVGWHHAERQSLVERGPADLALALALVHHLAIGGNVPLASIASFLGAICRYLIVEFVPKEDSQVRQMLALREDVFDDYTQPSFEFALAAHFTIVESVRIQGTVRTLYLMERR